MEKAKKIFNILMHKKIRWSTVGWTCVIVFILTSLYFATTDTIKIEGTINYLNEEAYIVFNFEVGIPFSLETEDKTLVEYAKSNHGDRVLCKIKRRCRLGVLSFELLSVDEILTDKCRVEWK